MLIVQQYITLTTLQALVCHYKSNMLQLLALILTTYCKTINTMCAKKTYVKVYN